MNRLARAIFSKSLENGSGRIKIVILRRMSACGFRNRLLNHGGGLAVADAYEVSGYKGIETVRASGMKALGLRQSVISAGLKVPLFGSTPASNPFVSTIGKSDRRRIL